MSNELANALASLRAKQAGTNTEINALIDALSRLRDQRRIQHEAIQGLEQLLDDAPDLVAAVPPFDSLDMSWADGSDMTTFRFPDPFPPPPQTATGYVAGVARSCHAIDAGMGMGMGDYRAGAEWLTATIELDGAPAILDGDRVRITVIEP